MFYTLLDTMLPAYPIRQLSAVKTYHYQTRRPVYTLAQRSVRQRFTFIVIKLQITAVLLPGLEVRGRELPKSS